MDALEQHGSQVHMIQHTELNYLLDLAASTYDVESELSEGNREARKLIWNIVQSSAFKWGRLQIAFHM